MDEHERQRAIGVVYEAMFRIRSTINDNMPLIGRLFCQSEAEDVQDIAVIADRAIDRLMKHEAQRKGSPGDG